MNEQQREPELVHGSKGKLYDPAEVVGDNCFTGTRVPLGESVQLDLQPELSADEQNIDIVEAKE